MYKLNIYWSKKYVSWRHFLGAFKF